MQKYPITINASEREVIIPLIETRKDKLSSIVQQLSGKNESVVVTIYESGFLMGATAHVREKIPETWKQLKDLLHKVREEAGVKITDLGNGMVRLEDKSGAFVTRRKYEWE